MPRKPVILTNEHPYHVISRHNNKAHFNVPMDYCFAIYSHALKKCIQKYNIRLHAFVLVSNHYHMILSTPDSNVSAALRYLLTETSRGIRVKCERENHIYGGRNRKSILETAEYYAHCIKYLYRNPIKAGLYKNVQDYPWSTIAAEKRPIQKLISGVSTGHDAFLPDDLKARLSWFNESPPDKTQEELERAVKRAKFDFKGHPKSKKKLDVKQGLFDPLRNSKVPGTLECYKGVSC